MRKQKNVELDGKIITVKELTVEDIWHFGGELKPLLDKFDLVQGGSIAIEIARSTMNLTKDDLIKLSFSDLELLETAWREVNAPFLKRYDQVFAIVTKAGLTEVLKQVFETIKQDVVQAVQKKETKTEVKILQS